MRLRKILTGATYLGIFLLPLVIGSTPLHADKGGKQERKLVCHYNGEGELKAMLLPSKAAEAHYKHHQIPSERPYVWSDGSEHCEPEPAPLCELGGTPEQIAETVVQFVVPIIAPSLPYTVNPGTGMAIVDTPTCPFYRFEATAIETDQPGGGFASIGVDRIDRLTERYNLQFDPEACAVALGCNPPPTPYLVYQN